MNTLTLRLLKKLKLKLLNNDKELSTFLVACFRLDNSINLFLDSWGAKMDRFRLGVSTNAKKCRDLKQDKKK